jgi:hypothetical protein
VSSFERGRIHGVKTDACQLLPGGFGLQYAFFGQWYIGSSAIAVIVLVPGGDAMAE